MYPEKCDSCKFFVDGCCEQPEFPKCYIEEMNDVLTDKERLALNEGR